MKETLDAVIIDDEIHCIETLEWQLENYCPNVMVRNKFNNPAEGLKYLMYNEIDLLFLDIEMPILNGFELLNAINKPSFGLIFTTAYDEFAIKAIKHQALDYLLKPIAKAELLDAVQRATDVKKDLKNRLHELMKDMENNSPNKLAIPSIEGFEFVDPEKILRCESDDNYTNIFLADGTKHLVSKTLKEIERQLKEHTFIRLHQSHLVNYKCIQKYVKGTGGYVVLSDGSQIPVSRRKKTELLEYIN